MSQNDIQIEIQRSVYNRTKFDDEYKANSLVNEHKNRFKFLAKFIKLFTPVPWLSGYNFKKQFIKDLISGVTVGAMHIPQGLAYGSLSSLPPIYGLYTSFFPGLFYLLFGKSKHLSVGTFAIISLLVMSTIQKIETIYSAQFNQTALNETNMRPYNFEDVKVQVATSLTLWAGLIQIILSIFQFGFIYKHLSPALLSGFTTAAAYQVITTQLTHLTGIYPPKAVSSTNQPKFFKLVHSYIALFSNLNQINWMAIGISAITISLLLIVRFHINERFKKQMRNIPVPTELIVLIIGTLVTYFAQLDTRFDLKIVGKISTDAFIIAILAFASSISVVDIYAKKYHYKTDSNKELFSLGVANTLSSFFQCFPCSGALARSAVFESSGGSSQIVTGMASTVVLAVLLWLAPLFEKLPKACLGAIITAALYNLLQKVEDLYHYWKTDKYECAVWFITFVGILLVGVEYGLVVGILVLIFLNTHRNNKPNIVSLAQLNGDIYVDKDRYLLQENVKIIRIDTPLVYLNTEYFKKRLNKQVPLHKKGSKSIFKACKSKCGSDKADSSADVNEATNMNGSLTTTGTVIIDCTLVNYIDESGVKLLKDIISEYKDSGIAVVFSNCDDKMIEMMMKLELYENLFQSIIYLTVQDAVLAVRP